jgi:[CysO sulfur-carrier protein]-S-L-cysteine hydrolase
MLTLHRDLLDAIRAQALRDAPVETCGVIAGPAGSDRPQRLIPIRNAARAPDFFRFDAHEHLHAWRDMEARGEAPVVIYHSHTHSPACPSREDIALATEPDAHYVIVSTQPGVAPAVRSFRIAGGAVVEEAIRVIAHAADPIPAAEAAVAREPS